MRSLLVLITLFINIGISKGQLNLVPNASFEDTITCHSYDYLEYNINNWKGGRGYFNPCKGPSRSVPSNELGFQYAKSGNAYCGLFTYIKSLDLQTYRHYIQVKLINTLVAAKRYNVEFYVSASEVMHAKSNSIGAYFTSDSFFVSSYFFNIVDVVPQVQNNPNNDLSDTANWTLVSGSFIANGTERYLTIGNFLPDSLSNVIPLDSVCSDPNGYACGVYFYIDDVSVTLIDETGLETLQPSNFNIYPNPSKDFLRIEIQENFNGTIKINDALGKEIYNSNLQNNITNFTIDTKDFESGLYFISFRNERGEVNKKFIKQ